MGNLQRRARVVLLAAGWALSACPSLAAARQLDSATFFKIERGMDEGEVLVRAGEPDLVTYPGVTATQRSIGRSVVNEGGNDQSFSRLRRTRVSEIKKYHYIPDKSEHDPFLTVITLRGGIVHRIDRTKVFDRSKLPEAPVESAKALDPAPSDTEIRRDRAERTLRAAEEYTATRERLMQQAAGQGALEGSGSDDEGTSPPRAASAAGADNGTALIYRSVDDEGTVYYGDRPDNGNPSIVDVE